MYNNLPALTESILWDDGLLAADYAALDARRLEDALKGYFRLSVFCAGSGIPCRALRLACGLPVTIS